MTDKTKRLSGGNILNPNIDNWPINHSTCGVDGCNNETDQAIAVVEKDGRKLAGRFSSFGKWKIINGKCEDLTLWPQYKWLHWITRCDYCFQREMVNHQKRKGNLNVV